MHKDTRQVPDKPLGRQVREFDETLSVFTVMRDYFRFKHMAPDGRPEMPEGYEAPLDTPPLRTVIAQRTGE